MANDPSKKFDIYVRESIQYYVETVPGIREQLREDNGHHYLVVPEKGGMIFAPNGNMKEITFIRFREGNKIVKDPVKLQRYARCHTAAYTTINDKLNEWLKDHPELNRDHFTTYSYNFATEMLYVQGVLDPNKPASKQPRKNIKLGSDVWDRIGKILDPEKTKKSDKLDSPRVYKHSRAEGEREERLARIAAEEKDLRKELTTVGLSAERKAEIERRLDALQAEKLDIANSSKGKKRHKLQDEPSEPLGNVLSDDEKAEVKRLEGKIRDEEAYIKKIQGNTSWPHEKKQAEIVECRAKIDDWEGRIADIKAPKDEQW